MFTHLHTHTQFSLLDGASRIEQLVLRAKELDMQSLAITDHGNMYGAVDFYKACKAQGIKPIIGCEMYVAPRTRYDKDKTLDREYYHLILLCKNELGYKNLIKMVSKSYTEGFYSKPRIDRDLLEKYHEGLICLSACLSGEIPKKLLQKDYFAAKEAALWHRELFGENGYYLELQNHSLKEQHEVNEGLKRISRETGIPLVATNDVHYVEKSDAQVQRVLQCIATNRTVGDESGFEFSSDEFYLKSEQEMLELFPDTPEAIENTRHIADLCEFDFEFGHTKLPYYETPNNENHFEYFKALCLDGMKKRYGDNPPQKYYDRLDYELETVEKMGYTDYYLIVADFVHYAKSKGIPVGPGRGSGAGSIAAYCMEITDLDPMKYNLLFERFLNPERVSMPDFDIDFCYVRRGEVIDYVTKKYGAEHVAQIVTFGTLACKAAIRDVGRALGMPYASVDAVAKLVPNDFHITLRQAIERSPQLRELTEENEQVHLLIETAKKVEGMPRNPSTHAAGVVITREPVSSYVPLATNDGVPVTQYIMTALEELGLLKMDFLGLRTLTVIDDASKAAGIDINEIPIDDAAVYEMFSKGHTEGVFQFESSGMKQMLTSLKPTRLEDLIAATSLYRPGPANQIDTFIENSHNPEKVTYLTEMLKPILSNTYGCMVYQEQVMQIFRELAGYSYGRADIVRRAMSKKKHDVMEKERAAFIDGCAKNKIDKGTADIIFDQMAEFAKYAFNKSHAACYALVAYRTAYLKCHYPAEFMAALMTSVLDQSSKIARYTAECKRLGLKLAPPSVNQSMKGFTANGNVINYGLLGIKNVGSDFVDGIIEERQKKPFDDIADFCSRMLDCHFNRRAAESLVRCGAMDCFNANRRQMLQALPAITANAESFRQSTKYGQVGFFELGGEPLLDAALPEVEEFPKAELLKMEKDATGLYLSGHPLDKYTALLSDNPCFVNICTLNEASQTQQAQFTDKSFVRVCGIITHTTLKKTKNGGTMAFVKLEDLTGDTEAVVFPKTLEKYSRYIFDGSIVTVSGNLSLEEEKEAKILAIDIDLPPNRDDIKNGKYTPLQKNAYFAKSTKGLGHGSFSDSKKSSSCESRTDKKKRTGLFLRFKNKNDPHIASAKRVTDIFDGNIPLYFYYTDDKHYELQPQDCFVEVNNTELAELKRILGDENVVFMQ